MISSRLCKKYIAAAVSALLATIGAIIAFFGGAAYAENDAVELSPLGGEGSVGYCCFEQPGSVFADGAGLLVPCENGLVAITGDNNISTRRDVRAEKVIRHLEHGSHSEYIIALNNGIISSYCGDSPAVELPLGEGIVDITLENDMLYAVSDTSLYTVALGDTSLNPARISVSALSSERGDISEVSALAVSCGYVFVSVTFGGGMKQDICTVAADGSLKTVILQSDRVLSLASCDGYLYSLTRGELSRYSVSKNGWPEDRLSASGSELISAYAFGGNVYCIDELSALHKFSSDLSNDVLVLASAASATGFFNLPNGVAAKNSTLFVADTANGRLAVYGETVSYANRDFYMPVSVASDSAGNVYVAYSFNKIGIFPAGGFSQSEERTVTANELGIIKQIAIDADKNIYILADNGLWMCGSAPDATPSRISPLIYKSITLGIGRDRLFALGEDEVTVFAGSNGSAYCSAPADGISLAVDLNGKAYVLTRTGIAVCSPSAPTTVKPLTLNGEPYSLGSDRGAVMLCTVSNAFAEHGDIIIVDTYKHRLLKADAKADLDANFIDGSYVKPDLVNSTTPALRESGLIRTALRTAGVYEYPMEAEPIHTVAVGTNVIVPMFDLIDAKEYSLVLVEDKANGRLIEGYVYRDVLSDALPYDYKPSDSASVFNSATPVYKYPSMYSPKAEGYSSLPANQDFELLDFVRAYRDVNGYTWYRIALANGCEGFVLSVNMSTIHYEPVFIRPAYNAKIISYKGSKFAPAYIVEGGKYIQVAELPTGTKVEVLNGFDSSQKYTHIKILDAERGTLTCYVETVYIEYEGVNVVLLVAILVIVITVILAAIIIGRMVYAKRKRLLHEDETEE